MAYTPGASHGSKGEQMNSSAEGLKLGDPWLFAQRSVLAASSGVCWMLMYIRSGLPAYPRVPGSGAEVDRHPCGYVLRGRPGRRHRFLPTFCGRE